MQESKSTQRALIVGGSGGLGKALARGIANRHIPLVVHGKDPGKLEVLRKELEADSDVEVFAEALARDSHLQGFLDRLALRFEEVTHYFHALGPFLEKPLSETGANDWEDMLFFNLKLPALCATSFASLVADRYSAGGLPGVIVLFGGTKTDTVRSFRTNAAYGAAKTGLAVFAKSLAREYADRGVSVLMVCPGIVDTEYVHAEKKNTWRRMMPGSRLTVPEDFAASVLDMAVSETVHLLNGSVITLDGGMVL